MPQTRGSCGHIKGTYDNHLSCINCCGCCRFHGCSVCNAWSDAPWDLVRRRRLYSDRSMGKKEAKEKKPRKSVSRTSSSSRPGLERTESADQTGSAAEGQMMTSHQLCLGHHQEVSESAEAPGFQASLTWNTGSEVYVEWSGDPTFQPRQTPYQGSGR